METALGSWMILNLDSLALEKKEKATKSPRKIIGKGVLDLKDKIKWSMVIFSTSVMGAIY